MGRRNRDTKEERKQAVEPPEKRQGRREAAEAYQTARREERKLERQLRH